MKQMISVGSKVKMQVPTPVPPWCEFEDDRGRVAKHVKNTIRERFFNCDTKLSAEIIHVARETEREKLRKSGRTKVRIRTTGGEAIIITVELNMLVHA